MLAYQEASADVGMATANDAEAMPPATEALHPAPPLPVGLIMYVMLRSASGGAAGPGKPRNPEPGKTANPGATDTRRCFLRVRAAPARKDGCHGHAPLLFACPCRAGQDPTDRVPPVRANLRTGARPHPGGEGRGRLSWSRHRLHGHANGNGACPWHPYCAVAPVRQASSFLSWARKPWRSLGGMASRAGSLALPSAKSSTAWAAMRLSLRICWTCRAARTSLPLKTSRQ